MSIDGVLARRGHPGDVGEHLVALGWITAAQVPTHAVWIRADDQQVGARAAVAVAGTGGQYDHVAGAERKLTTVRSAKHHVHGSASDSEHLVGCRMEVVKREDSVPPRSQPPVPGKQLLVRGSVGHAVERVVVEEHRER